MCAVPWEVLSTVGGVQYSGRYLEYRGGGVQYCGGIMINVERYLEYRGGCSVPWGISSVLWGLS